MSGLGSIWLQNISECGLAYGLRVQSPSGTVTYPKIHRIAPSGQMNLNTNRWYVDEKGLGLSLCLYYHIINPCLISRKNKKLQAV